MKRLLHWLAALVAVIVLDLHPVSATAADPAAWPPKIDRRLPPAGKSIPAEDERRLTHRLAEAESRLAAVDHAGKEDIEILTKAVSYALGHGEFFDVKRDVERAERVLALAETRTAELAQGKTPWAEQHGTLVRGFRSHLDDSVQPYGLVIPESLDLSKPVPLYVWLHGRGDTTCDLQFTAQFIDPKTPPGKLLPSNAIVLHPFGRYCNGWKSAGEIDVLEAIESVKQNYKIDDDRIVLAGFSMGGAGAWHLGAHYADQWCAVHAGAGFVDVRRYQNITPDKLPPWYEQTLWGLYDAPDYRRNLLNVPLIAYSGELDKQKAAADIMAEELAAEGLTLTHLIGPGMGHAYHPEVLAEIQKQLDVIVAKGRDNFPQKVSLQTKTLRYGKMFWIEIYGLDRHWERSRVDAEVIGDESLKVVTKNVTALRIQAPWKTGRFAAGAEINIDGQVLRSPEECGFEILSKGDDGNWQFGFADKEPTPRAVKRRGLQGPIDDAFVSRFLVVTPSGTSESPVDQWVDFESRHFTERWELLMRGKPRVATTEEFEKGATGADPGNLVLWGTPQSNPLMARALSVLPIRWTETTVGIGDLNFDAKKVVPVLIYPIENRYVVINSGLTFREAHDRTNSLQNPKLPDWAFIDVTEPPTDEYPGKVLASGFFDENWQYVPAKK